MSVLDTKDYYKPYFLETHSDFKNIFYDTDFSEVRKHINAVYELLKQMDLRQSRAKTLQIARSVFDYESQKDFYVQYPHLYYDFRFGDTRICIGNKKYRKQDEFFVNCCGYNPSDRYVETVGHFGYGASSDINGVLTLFSDIVRDFLLEHASSLF